MVRKLSDSSESNLVKHIILLMAPIIDLTTTIIHHSKTKQY